MERSISIIQRRKFPCLWKKNTKYNLLLKLKALLSVWDGKFLEKLGSNEKNTFGFKSHNSPPFVNKLAEFELDLLKMLHNIEFRPVRNNFFSKLKDDAKVINNNKEY